MAAANSFGWGYLGYNMTSTAITEFVVNGGDYIKVHVFNIATSLFPDNLGGSILTAGNDWSFEKKFKSIYFGNKSHKAFMIDLVAESSSSLLSGPIAAGLEPFIPKKDSKYVNVWLDFGANTSASAASKTANKEKK